MHAKFQYHLVQSTLDLSLDDEGRANCDKTFCKISKWGSLNFNVFRQAGRQEDIL